jgi:hypothetical protein
MGGSDSRPIDNSSSYFSTHSSIKANEPSEMENGDVAPPPVFTYPNIYDNSNDRKGNNTKEIKLVIKIDGDTQGKNINLNINTKDGNSNTINIDQNIGGQNKTNQTVGYTISGSNSNIDINFGENQKYEKEKPSTKTNDGNIDPNFGENQRTYEKDTKKPSTTKGNVNINFGGNEYYEGGTNKPSPNGDNIDNNIGGGGRTKVEEENKTPTTTDNPDINKDYIGDDQKKSWTNTGNIDPNRGNSFQKPEGNNKPTNDIENTKKVFTNKPASDNNIEIDNPYLNDIKEDSKKKFEEMSKNIVTFNFNDLNLKDPKDLNLLKLHASQKISEGFFPLFLKVGAEKPHFFYVKSDSSCRILLDYYNLINGTEKGRIILYNGGNRIDLDTQIKDLKIQQFGIIEGYV